MSLGFVLVEYMSTIPIRINGDSMWPTFRDGDIIQCQTYVGQIVNIGDIIVFPRPNLSNSILVKRVISINNDQCIVEGDNPDPNASTDSHNFGPINISSIIAIRHTDNPV